MRESPLLWFLGMLLFGLLVIALIQHPAFLSSLSASARAASSSSSRPVALSNGESYQDVARRDAEAASIAPEIFVRQIEQESGFNPRARSSVGACGIAQFMPQTASGLGINCWDPVASLWAAAHLMARYLHSYGSYALALAAYNAGSGTLNHALNACGLSWYSCVPAETQRYISIILS